MTKKKCNCYSNIAQGSIEESRYGLILAEDLRPGDVDELRRLLEEINQNAGSLFSRHCEF